MAMNESDRRKGAMNSPTIQTTLLTSHKGVDLHAASALLVMQKRLSGGEQLVNLLRCELHTFWGESADWNAARLLATGRYYNPNKHHFGLFAGPTDGADWFADETPGRQLSVGWPGQVRDTDLAEVRSDDAGLYQALLGGDPPAGCTGCDLVSFAYGQVQPVLSGVLWRLVLRGDAAEARQLGEELAVARHRKQGLLVNPHMDSWFAVAAAR